MRIVVVDVAAKLGGALSILKDFYNYVKTNDTDNEWIFLVGGHYLEETENIKIEIIPNISQNHIRRLLFDNITGKKIIMKYKPDVVFSLQNTMPRGLDTRQVLYIHQAIPFQTVKKFSFLKKNERNYAIYQYIIGGMIKHSIHKCDQIISQTQWMKRAIIEQTGKNAEKIHVVYPNVPVVVPNRSAQWSHDSFFFPGFDGIYKNVGCLDRAVMILQKNGYSPDVSVTMEPGKYDGRIHGIGRIEREEVVYRYCIGTLVFPSFVESCPLPLLEARMAGTVILASDCPFSREILAGYENAYFFDPFKPEELAALMEDVLVGRIVKQEVRITPYSEKGSWKELIDILERMK